MGVRATAWPFIATWPSFEVDAQVPDLDDGLGVHGPRPAKGRPEPREDLDR